VIEAVDPAASTFDVGPFGLVDTDAPDRCIEMDAAAARHDPVGHFTVEIAAAALGIGKLIEQSLVAAPSRAHDRRLEGLGQRELLDALGREIGIQIAAGDSP